MKKLIQITLAVFFISSLFVSQVSAAITLDVALKDINKVGSVIKTFWTSSNIDAGKTLDLYLTSSKTGIGYPIKRNLSLNGSYDWVIPSTVASAKDYQLSLSTNDKGPSDSSEYSSPFEIGGSSKAPVIREVSSEAVVKKSNANGDIAGIISTKYYTSGSMKGSEIKMNISCPEGVKVFSRNSECDESTDLGRKTRGNQKFNFVNNTNIEQEVGFTFDLYVNEQMVQRVFEFVKVPGADDTLPSIEVISPNGGETINILDPLKVVLKSTNVYPIKHYINLVNQTKDASFSLDSLLGSYGVSFTQDQINQKNQSIIVNIPSSYNMDTANKFKIEICANGICDTSDTSFTITKGSTSTQPLPITNTPVLNYVQAKAADKNEIFSEEEPILYGENFTKQTQVYILLNGSKKFFDMGVLNSGSVSFATPKRGTIPNGTYQLFAENGSKMSNGITISYKNQIASAPTIKVLSPNGGETLYKKQKQKIKWESAGVDRFTIILDARWEKGGPDKIIAEDVRGNSFEWEIPSNIVASDGLYSSTSTTVQEEYKIIVQENTRTKELVGDSSDGYFKIKNNVTLPTPTPTTICQVFSRTRVGTEIHNEWIDVLCTTQAYKNALPQNKREVEIDTSKKCQILYRKNVNGVVEATWTDAYCEGNAYKDALDKNKRIKKVPLGTVSSDTNTLTHTDLELGMTHKDVLTLQQYLNSNGYIINTQTGQPGSIGYESDYFGEKTKQALIKFQQDKNISPAEGYFGAKTRGVMGI